MKCIFFSDLHVKKPADNAEKLFLKLCHSDEMKNATHLFLLGDLFDLMIGNHIDYFSHYNIFFNQIIKLLNEDKTIVYIEGNHDFHFKKAIESFLKDKTSHYKNFRYLTRGENFNFGDKKFYVCHGDEVDDQNESFKKWKKVYTSKQFAFLVNKLLSFNLIQFLGRKVSQNSKDRGSKSFNYDQMKKKYVEGAQRLIKQKGGSGVICGHTHIQEYNEYQDKTLYINTGFPLKDKNFLFYNGSSFSFVSLAESSN